MTKNNLVKETKQIFWIFFKISGKFQIILELFKSFGTFENYGNFQKFQIFRKIATRENLKKIEKFKKNCII